MAFIYTRKGQRIIVDDADFVWVNQFTWYLTKGRTPYVKCTSKRKSIALHRMLMDFPLGLCVDHINGDILDNRRENLRVCTNKENSWNRKKHKGHHLAKGVYKILRGPNWHARVCVNGKQVYSKPMPYEEAVLAYNEMAKKYFGEFARLNPVE